MIEKIGPTIYKGGTIYNIGGGGGGGGGGGDIPENIQLYLKLKETVSARFSQNDLNQFHIKDTDKVNLVMELNLNQANVGVYATILNLDTYPLTGVINAKSLICVSFAGTNNRFIFNKDGYANMFFNDTDDSFKLLSCKMLENYMEVKFNGETKTASRSSHINDDLVITQIWPNTAGGFASNALFYLYNLEIKSSDGNIKYDFCPALNTDTNKIGLYEKITGTFIPGNNNSNFELIGEL